MRILLLAVMIIVLWSVTSLANSNFPPACDTVRVKPGDTIWKIAAKYTANNEDIRNTIIAIRDANKLNKNAEVFPGQELVIPVKRASN